MTMTVIDSRLGVKGRFQVGNDQTSQFLDGQYVAQAKRVVQQAINDANGIKRDRSGAQLRFMISHLPEMLEIAQDANKPTPKPARSKGITGPVRQTTGLLPDHDLLITIGLADLDNLCIAIPCGIDIRTPNASIWQYWLQYYFGVDSTRVRIAGRGHGMKAKRQRNWGCSKRVKHKIDWDGNEKTLTVAFMYCVGKDGKMDMTAYASALRQCMGWAAKDEQDEILVLMSRHQLDEMPDILADSSLFWTNQRFVTATHDAVNLSKSAVALEFRLPDAEYDIRYTPKAYYDDGLNYGILSKAGPNHQDSMQAAHDWYLTEVEKREG